MMYISFGGSERNVPYFLVYDDNTYVDIMIDYSLNEPFPTAKLTKQELLKLKKMINQALKQSE